MNVILQISNLQMQAKVRSNHPVSCSHATNAAQKTVSQVMHLQTIANNKFIYE